MNNSNDNRKNKNGFSWLNPAHVLAFGFGAGKMPVAPGTFGSLLAIPLYLLLENILLWQYLLAILLVTVVGIIVSDITSKDMATDDHPGIVIDEVAGMLITYILLPPGWAWLVLGFLLFRLFDIWKPFPIRQIDRNVKGGLGVMLDDLLAGIYAFLILQLCHIVWITLL